MLCILKAIIVWVIMLLVGTNLIGFIVRGLFWSPPSVDAPVDQVREVLARESSRMSLANGVMTFGSLILAAMYIFSLFHFWNLSLALASVVIMASRLPDLIWEIHAGRKPAHGDRPRGPLYFLASTFSWAALVLVWYSLCQWKS
jgi:hypothetical protein